MVTTVVQAEAAVWNHPRKMDRLFRKRDAGAYIIPPLGHYDSAVEIIRQLSSGSGQQIAGAIDQQGSQVHA